MANPNPTNIENRLFEMGVGAAKLFSFFLVVGLFFYLFKVPLVLLALVVTPGIAGLYVIAIMIAVALWFVVVQLLKKKPQQQLGAFALGMACMATYAAYWGVFVVGEKWAQRTPFSDRSTTAVLQQGNNLALMLNIGKDLSCYRHRECFLPLVYGFVDTVTVSHRKRPNSNIWTTRTLKLASLDQCKSETSDNAWWRNLNVLQEHGLFSYCIKLENPAKAGTLPETLPDGVLVKTSRYDPSLIRPFTSGRFRPNVATATQVTNQKMGPVLRRWERVGYRSPKTTTGRRFKNERFIASLYGYNRYPLAMHFDLPLHEAIEKANAALNHEHVTSIGVHGYMRGVLSYRARSKARRVPVSPREAELYFELMAKACEHPTARKSCIEIYERLAKKHRIVAKPE